MYKAAVWQSGHEQGSLPAACLHQFSLSFASFTGFHSSDRWHSPVCGMRR